MKVTEAVWAEGRAEEINRAFAFWLDLKKPTKGKICLSAASCYKLYADGKFIGYGPARAAHGYCRFSEYEFSARYILAEVYSINVQNFYRVKQRPFFACGVTASDGTTYTSSDFACCELTDRVQKVQRYSFQRGFTEVYELCPELSAPYFGKTEFPRVKTERVDLPQILPLRTREPVLKEIFPVAAIDCGAAKTNDSLPVWSDRSQTLVGTVLEGFLREEWQAFPTDEVSRLEFSSAADGDYLYATYDFGHIRSGFISLKIRAENGGEVWVTFDEILSDGKNGIDPFRGETANAFKWTVKSGGEYSVATFEPYAFRYARVIYSRKITVKISLCEYENRDADKFEFSFKDERINEIMEAARNTFAHNAVDLLTDCPSRERAGWLSDSYFSSAAERVFTGDNKAERAFLENYIYADKSGLPDGMIPRCYPADYYEKDGYIPNWAMWYILELQNYFGLYGYDEIIEKSEKNVRGLIRYFSGYENEYGALENLGGWVFVEWSAANDPSHICGVNVPSNACYYAVLLAAAEIYGMADLKLKAEKLRKFLLSRAYKDGFFVDNLVRNSASELEPTDNYTETCQYYMFYFRVADKTDYKELFYKMLDEYGKGDYCGRGKKKLAESNMIYGVYMRLELLMRDGRKEELLSECIKYFYKMAKRTGTLWEHNGACASCDHGFASYVAKFLIFANDL